jgi:poly(A) polymerase
LWRAVCVERDRRMDHGVAPYPALQQAAVAVIGRECQRISIPRRVSTIVYEIWELQGRLESRRPRTIHRLLENKRFRAAYDFLVLRGGAGEVPESLAEWWTQIQEHSVPEQQEMIKALNPGPARNKRRRPRKRSNEQSKPAT